MISQDELTTLYRLKQSLIDTIRKHDELERRLSLRLARNERIEEGQLTAIRYSFTRRHLSWKNIVIDLRSEKFAESMLEKAPAAAYSRFVLKGELEE